MTESSNPEETPKLFAYAIEQLIQDLRLTSPRELWTKAGVQKQRSLWYNRISHDSEVVKPVYKKDVDKLLANLYATSQIKLNSSQINSLYKAIGIDTEHYDYDGKVEISQQANIIHTNKSLSPDPAGAKDQNVSSSSIEDNIDASPRNILQEYSGPASAGVF